MNSARHCLCPFFLPGSSLQMIPCLPVFSMIIPQGLPNLYLPPQSFSLLQTYRLIQDLRWDDFTPNRTKATLRMTSWSSASACSSCRVYYLTDTLPSGPTSWSWGLPCPSNSQFCPSTWFSQISLYPFASTATTSITSPTGVILMAS